jgi:hypothetical protein
VKFLFKEKMEKPPRDYSFVILEKNKKERKKEKETV